MVDRLIDAILSVLFQQPSRDQYRRSPYLWWGLVLSFWGGVASAVAVAALGYTDLAIYAFIVVLLGGFAAAIYIDYRRN